MDSSTRTYAELIAYSNYSFLRGASHPEELVTQAVALGLKALAITDRNGVYAIPKAFHEAKRHPGFKLIVGAELIFSDHPPLVCLARDRAGYGLLCRMLTCAHAEKPKGEGALLWRDFLKFMENPARAGLFMLPKITDKTRFEILRELFPESLYMPLGRYLDGFDKKRTQEALTLQKKFNLPLIATNEARYHIPQRCVVQDVVTCIREGVALSDAGFKLFSNHERYLKSPVAMGKLFADLPEALANTLTIADRCLFSPAELRYRYPSEWIPQGETAQSYLEKLIWQGADTRYPQGVPDDVARQIRHEISLIAQLQFADYFLTIYEIIDFARQKKILCQGRGSAANSVVCYCLGITAIDPVRMNLLFERFISVERGEPPDIDVDFEHERREEVIQHIYEKYGRDRAAMVSAVVTYRSKSAFREVCKAFGVNVGTLSAHKVERDFEKLAAKPLPHLREQITGVMHHLKSFPRHLTIHSGGFTLSADPVIEIVPVEPATMPGRTIIQWDKYDLDILGLLKVDVLSLGMLSALRKTLQSIGKELHELPAEDSKTYEMIQHGDTVGTFQIESRAQMNMLGRLLPKTFYDLVIEIAIVRPGPIVGKMVHPYLKRRRGIEKVIYPDPRVEQILGKTLGIPLFQEQVMKLAIDLAGFTPGEADQLRRAINGWRATGDMPAMGKRLLQGLLQSGLPQAFAEQIFEQIQGFSMYGFPESHSASFALLAYASSYLKCHYPAEFLCALVNSQPMGFYAVHSLIDDAKRHGIKILPVDPNISAWDCALEDGGVRLGFRVVQGLAKKDAEDLFEKRRQKKFSGLLDFLARTQIRRDVVERLAMGNAFACFKMSEREALWTILEFSLLNRIGAVQQLKLFEKLQTPAANPPQFSPPGEYEQIRNEYKAFDLSTRNHPMVALRNLYQLPKTTTADVRQVANRKRLTVAGLTLVRQQPPTANGTTFSVLEDEYGFLDLVIFKDVFAKYRELFLNECFLKVTGEIHRDTHSISMLVTSMEAICSGERQSLTIEPRQYF